MGHVGLGIRGALPAQVTHEFMRMQTERLADFGLYMPHITTVISVTSQRVAVSLLGHHPQRLTKPEDDRNNMSAFSGLCTARPALHTLKVPGSHFAKQQSLTFLSFLVASIVPAPWYPSRLTRSHANATPSSHGNWNDLSKPEQEQAPTVSAILTDGQRFNDDLILRDDIARHLGQRADDGTCWWHANATQQTNPRPADIRCRIKREVAAILMKDHDFVFGRSTTQPTTNSRNVARSVDAATRSRPAIETNRRGRSQDIDNDVENSRDERTHHSKHPRLDTSVEAEFVQLKELIESKNLKIATKNDQAQNLRRNLSAMTDKYNSLKVAMPSTPTPGSTHTPTNAPLPNNTVRDVPASLPPQLSGRTIHGAQDEQDDSTEELPIDAGDGDDTEHTGAMGEVGDVNDVPHEHSDASSAETKTQDWTQRRRRWTSSTIPHMTMRSPTPKNIANVPTVNCTVFRSPSCLA
ncbi:hypothetical protein BKA63DRAFT_607577 [Paraphoma chrysanthemicola]|nr:hypothetical protein BKA63DRAFT_607577 [Paraphoma chrysanthemicola]